MATVMSVGGETGTKVSRMTKDGRKVTYQLTVIQQPERARACGSGAKSSADRRPVDPPPIVELRIFEGEGEVMNDITFGYNANFFLFATLEPSRPIAHGRVPQNPSAFPVLTGMFVSGMAYLDRPVPAGYFLFPDLSVRHEGKYRLSFNLYEELKDADSESDPNDPTSAKNRIKMAGPHAPSTFVDWRLEVKSKPFTVFSAKKFPGLAESTVLSRIVAEQGCRVRIRRDVRMRRRDNKAGHDYDEFEDERDYARARATASPEPYAQPAQNVETIRQQPSVPAVDATQAYVAEQQRRASLHEPSPYGQQAPTQTYGPPPVAQASHENYSHMPYAPSMHGQYHQSIAQVAYPQPQMGYMQYQQPHGVPPQHGRHDSLDHPQFSRRESISFHQPQQPGSSSGATYAYPDKSYRPQSTFPHLPSSVPSGAMPRPSSPGASAQPLPPLKVPMNLEPRYEAPTNSAATSTVSRTAPPLLSPAVDGGVLEPDVPPQTAPLQPKIPEPARSAKRSYGSTFDESQYDQALRHGMRPSEVHHDAEPTQASLDEEEDENGSFPSLKMQYKRADGTEISRRLPSAV